MDGAWGADEFQGGASVSTETCTGAFPRGPLPSRPGGPPHGRKQFLYHDGGRHGAQLDRARDPLRTAWPRTDRRTAAGPDRTPSGPTGTRTHAGEAALGTDAVRRTTPVEGWPFRTEKRAFRFPRGQASEKKGLEKKGPETSKPPRRAGHRAKRAHPSRQRAHLSHAPDRLGVFSVQACAQTRSRTCRRHAHAEGTHMWKAHVEA